MGRPRGIVHDQNTRDKIQAAMIINRLAGCVMGEIELSSQQVNAAKALLNKVLPDLQSVQSSIEIEGGISVRTVKISGTEPNNA